MYLTAILEFSEDDLSDTTPTWVEVTSVLLEASWSSGIQTEGDDPQPGTASFRLHDVSRNFEPDYAAGAFYPNVVPDRRFRLRITSSAVTYSEGVWYTQQFEPVWPGGAMAQESVVSCGDGMTILALDDLPLFDPPDADSYADVIASYEPWGYWRLGEPEGTRAVAQVRTVRRGKGKKRRKVKVRTVVSVTAAEAGGVSGPAGVYYSTPALGQPGAIVGDTDTSVLFAAGEEVRLTVDGDTSLNSRTALTVMAWVKATAWPTTLFFVHGPSATAGGSLFMLEHSATGTGLAFRVNTTSGTVGDDVGAPAATGDWLFVAGTYDGQQVRLYVDAVEAVVTAAPGPMRAITAPQVMTLMEGSGSGSVYADEIAVVEKCLTAGQIAGLYEAGAQHGYPEQTAGERIAEVVDHDLWAETGIQTSGRMIMPEFQHGQPRRDVIAEAAHAEGPRTMFGWRGNGNPYYLGHEWQASAAAYNTVQATFGNQPGEVPFEGVGMVSDDDVYNHVTVSHEGGEAAVASLDSPRRRANTEWTDVLLMDHQDVESLAEHVLGFYAEAQFRPARLELSGVDTAARAQILTREIGDLIRVKHRPRGGTVIDRVCNIIGFEKHLDAQTGHLSCTWFLGRGFNAAAGGWRAGLAGFSEAGSTTVAA